MHPACRPSSRGWGGVKENKPSLLYPLAIGNLVKAAMNYAALVGEPRVTADVVREA